MQHERVDKPTLSYFSHFFVFLAIAAIIEFVYAGFLGFFQGTTLSLLELSLSFDNAVVNALILVNMPPVWRKRFLTWGMLIAVFGVRFIFPILIVFVTTDLSFTESFTLAINDPVRYEQVIMQSHHVVMAFGGIFLLMIFLSFLFNEEKEVHWIGWIEKHAARWSSVGDLKILASLLTLAIIGYIAPNHVLIGEELKQIDKSEIILPMVYGVVLYLAINFLRGILEDDGNDKKDENEKEKIGHVAEKTALKGGFASFMYLELIDMSFSFDGVLGAFAVSQNVVIIMLGLGVGAFAVRSLTLLMVDRNTVTEYKYLEHGAMWSIGLLSAAMLFQIFAHLPSWFVTVLAIVPIGIAFIHSIMENKRDHD